MTKKRELNLELLRIVAMIIIIIFHFSDWGGLLTIERPYTSPNMILGEIINWGGSFGVDVFILISGYFLVDAKFSSKKLLKILLEVFFYSVLMYLICIPLGKSVISVGNIKKNILPITYDRYWFATLYVLLYSIFPYINIVINNITKKQYGTLIVILSIFVAVLPTLFIGSNLYTGNFIRFILLYLIAGYIKRYYKAPVKNHKLLLFIAISLFILCFMPMLYTKLKMTSKALQLNTMTSLPMLLLTISTFLLFKNLKVDNNNKIIPFFAKAAFAVYLIHINSNFREYLFYDILKIQNLYDAKTIYLALYILAASLVIYIVCTIIDTIRRKLLEEPLFKIKKFDKVFNKIDLLLDVNNTDKNKTED